MAKAEPQKEKAPRRAMTRMHQRTEKEIADQVAKVPSLTLDKTVKRAESIEMIRANLNSTHSDATPALLARRADLAGLPVRRGLDARLTSDAVQHLARGASVLQSTQAEKLATTLAADKTWLGAERVPALMQVLMVGPEASRVILARHLAGVQGQRGAAALVQIALFDPSAVVRQAAITSLERRPASDSRDRLLRGFQSPWPVVAEHAAEALVALRQTESASALLSVLNRPDPQAPYTKSNGPTRYVRELVRINHKINCLMCHPPSFKTGDALRGAVPPLKERVSFGYMGAPETQKVFVRADITFLKQDYSVMLDGKRYDLFVRERLATDADSAAALERTKSGQTGQQKAAAFALRELSGEEPGPRAVNWVRFAQKQERLVKRR
jgi:hypothetical protein